ncbi:hypothetical protein AB7179_00070 [Providencia manganoxydans]|uniref:hypothetical protein n=1 Tax=Providencia manganoxydans TaxID=2923283 RepID=UPI0034E55D58
MDKSRQQFEEWRSKNKSSTINLFDVWQASRESLEIELPNKYNPELAGNVKTKNFFYGINQGIDKCRDILISNGVKIKNE